MPKVTELRNVRAGIQTQTAVKDFHKVINTKKISPWTQIIVRLLFKSRSFF